MKYPRYNSSKFYLFSIQHLTMEQELRELEKEIGVKSSLLRGKIQKIKNQQDLHDLEKDLSHCDDLLKSFQLNIYDIDSYKRLDGELHSIRDELLKKREKFSLIGTKPIVYDPSHFNTISLDSEPAQILSRAQKIQQKDTQTLRDLNALLEQDTLPLAVNTLGTLQHQGDQMRDVQIHLGNIDDGVSRAGYTMRKIGSRLACNKCLGIVIAIILIAIIIIVVLSTTLTIPPAPYNVTKSIF